MTGESTAQPPTTKLKGMVNALASVRLNTALTICSLIALIWGGVTVVSKITAIHSDDVNSLQLLTEKVKDLQGKVEIIQSMQIAFAKLNGRLDTLDATIDLKLDAVRVAIEQHGKSTQDMLKKAMGGGSSE